MKNLYRLGRDLIVIIFGWSLGSIIFHTSDVTGLIGVMVGWTLGYFLAGGLLMRRHRSHL